MFIERASSKKPAAPQASSAPGEIAVVSARLDDVRRRSMHSLNEMAFLIGGPIDWSV
jgi:hypothetical protein